MSSNAELDILLNEIRESGVIVPSTTWPGGVRTLRPTNEPSRISDFDFQLFPSKFRPSTTQHDPARPSTTQHFVDAWPAGLNLTQTSEP